MVFKGRFFSSKKSNQSSSSGSNTSSSLSPASNSSIKSDKKKSKTHLKDDPFYITRGNPSNKFSCLALHSKLKDGLMEKEVKGKETDEEVPCSVSPILASSLGLNKIKTRSGPLPHESFFGFKGSSGVGLGSSSLGSGGKKTEKEVRGHKKIGILQNVDVDNMSNSDSATTRSPYSMERSPNVMAPLRSEDDQSGKFNSSCGLIGDSRSADICTPEESESPRFQAIMRVTSAPRKKFPGDIKSFSHELNSKGVRPFPFRKSRGLNNAEEILVVIRTKFDKEKEEVDKDLAVFAADLIGILEKNSESHPEWQETIEDLLVLARRCSMTPPGEFWLQCEGIVQELDDKRQELPIGMLKRLNTRMLFILTRCTRLLQFHKESGLAEGEHVLQLRHPRVQHSAGKQIQSGLGKDEKISSASKTCRPLSARKFYSQEQPFLKGDRTIQSKSPFTPLSDRNSEQLRSPSGENQIAFCNKLQSIVEYSPEQATIVKEENESKGSYLKTLTSRRDFPDVDQNALKQSELISSKDAKDFVYCSKHQRKPSWGSWGNQQSILDENSIICRICEEEIATSLVEDHSRICAIADRCDQKGLSVNERLARVAQALTKMMESFTEKNTPYRTGSPDFAKISNSNLTEESDVVSARISGRCNRGSEDMPDCFPETCNTVLMGDLKDSFSRSFKMQFIPKSDRGMSTSSAGSTTPRSPLLTPTSSQIDLLVAGKGSYTEEDDLPQINELADIAQCALKTPLNDDGSGLYLLSCLEDLRMVVDRKNFDTLTVETFGTRIEKLIQEKYLQLCELVDYEKVDLPSTIVEEDSPLEDDVVHSLRTSPVHSSRDRTSIDDFEIIKPISRGTFGRVFLAKKRTTGDLFAIKVLKKADMIRKNAVESILAERDILISVCNPFVVRFFYSFTCRENLYLVMEYLNGGDLYSLLRNLGCLDEDVTRVYIAEVVLALEYIHSLHVVHRDLKPDNLLIAHNGHIKLTDFGLSKVGLINSTDDLSGPAVNGTSLFEDDEPQLSSSEHHKERRKKRSAVGTPDYLAPEILLGTGHGYTADWWSVGVILFELIVGIPPFNAEHPQKIFDNILNRKIPWPLEPGEMSYEAQDLIDRLLMEDPYQRLGANGAAEVKEHPFFRDINWDTLARQKAAFIPTSESDLDTSYFTSRFSWDPSDEHFYPVNEVENSTDDDSISGSSSCLSNQQDEEGDGCGGFAEFGSGSPVNYPFENFSFKNLDQLASINYDLLSKGWNDEPSKTSA